MSCLQVTWDVKQDTFAVSKTQVSEITNSAENLHYQLV